MTAGIASYAAVAFVRSTMAHARLLSVDTGLARRAPGVHAIVLGADLGLIDISVGDPLPAGLVRPLLARDWVRFVGEPVAAVVAATAAQAEDAAELVEVEYGLLPVVTTVEQAAIDDTLVHPVVDSNAVVSVVNELAELEARAAEAGEVPSWPDTLPTVVEVALARSVGAPLERRAAAAAWRDDGGLHVTAACDDVDFWRARLADLYSLRPSQVLVTEPPTTGGSFGTKESLGVEALVLARLAQIARRPVRWQEAPAEHELVAHQRGARVSTTLHLVPPAVDGSPPPPPTVARVATHTLHDVGAYPTSGAAHPYRAALAFGGPYGIETAIFGGVGVVTTLAPVEASPAGGGLEVTVALERAIDAAAARVGTDGAAVRREMLRRAHGAAGTDLLDLAELTAATIIGPAAAHQGVGVACPSDVESSLVRREVRPAAAVLVAATVDPVTGAAVVDHVVTAHHTDGSVPDALVRSAAEQGVVLGLGKALTDEIRHDPFGRPVRPGRGVDAGLTFSTTPTITVELVPTGDCDAPTDLDVVCTAALAGTVAAIVNAVGAVLDPMGFTRISLPLGAEALWRAGVSSGRRP